MSASRRITYLRKKKFSDILKEIYDNQKEKQKTNNWINL